jgi:hypothetical protein
MKFVIRRTKCDAPLGEATRGTAQDHLSLGSNRNPANDRDIPIEQVGRQQMGKHRRKRIENVRWTPDA